MNKSWFSYTDVIVSPEETIQNYQLILNKLYREVFQRYGIKRIDRKKEGDTSSLGEPFPLFLLPAVF
jgi:hypothetical protein